MKILLAGCTGFVGLPLIERLKEERHQLVVLSRHPQKYQSLGEEGVQVLGWDGRFVRPDEPALEGVDAVINLSGAGIADKRWTPARKKEILQSRLLSTQAMVEWIKSRENKPQVFVNASAIGFYGPVADGDVTESTGPGESFLADTCKKWEEAAKAAEDLNVRTIRLRIGIVLEKGGGAMDKMVPPFKFFAGGPLGSGKQMMSWIHRRDLVEIILFCLKQETLSGAVNATAPEPVSMKVFCQLLGKELKRPSWAPVPGFALKLLLGEMADMLLTGQSVIPEKVLQEGFNFEYATLQSALADIL